MALLEHLRASAREARAAYGSDRGKPPRRRAPGPDRRTAADRRRAPDDRGVRAGRHYEYDDEGGYYRCLGDGLDFGEADPDDQDEYWIEDLAGDWTQEALLKLFDIDDVGESLLPVERVRELAASEGSSSDAHPTPRRQLRQEMGRRATGLPGGP